MTAFTSPNTWAGLTLTGRRSGPYRIAGPLKQGGMVFVLRVADAAGVVVKVPQSHLTPLKKANDFAPSLVFIISG